jgi:hypothetical protein
MDAQALTITAMRKMLSINGATKDITVAGTNSCRAVASECTFMINAMRGRTMNQKRWNIAIVKTDLVPDPASLKIGAAVVIDGFSGTVEEDDFIEDCGVVSCFVS